MRNKTMRTKVAAALALLILGCGIARGQDQFFNTDVSGRDDNNAQIGGTWVGFGSGGAGTEGGGSWDGFGFGGVGTEGGGTWNPFGAGSAGTEGGGTWVGFEYGDPTPLGDGLLLTALSGACYAALRSRRRTKTQN